MQVRSLVESKLSEFESVHSWVSHDPENQNSVCLNLQTRGGSMHFVEMRAGEAMELIQQLQKAVAARIRNLEATETRLHDLERIRVLSSDCTPS
jgi:hypothetical protein